MVILGGGAAAFAATEADRLGISTVIINDGLPMAGTCVNVGYMPTKYLLAVAGELHNISYPRFASIASSPPAFDFEKAMTEKDILVTAARRKNYQDILAGFGQVTSTLQECPWPPPGCCRLPWLPHFSRFQTWGYLATRQDCFAHTKTI